MRDAVAPGRVRHGVLIPTLFMFAALATFIGLGTWQLQRKAWKEALIHNLEQRLSAGPVDLPGRENWPSLNPANDEFRRVKLAAVFQPGDAALVYTMGSTVRSDVAGPGYWVLSPARTVAGDLVVVDRGFLPQDQKEAAAGVGREIGRTVEIVGVLRWPEPRSLFTPADDSEHNLWFVRDPAAIAQAKHWGAVAPFFIEMESPRAPTGLPRTGAIRPTLRNEHLQYAITWYGLAVVVIVMFMAWLRARRRAITADGVRIESR